MNTYPDKIQTIHEGHCEPTTLNYGFPTRKIETSCPSGTTIKDTSENELLRVCQALLLSICVLLLSYHSVRYGRSEYSILESGRIVQGYKRKAIITLSLGYSVPYSLVSFLAIGMLAYSLISKKPRWSLPSIVLYLADVVYDISAGIAAIWLFFSRFSLPTALSYTTGSLVLIFGEIWIWMGVLCLYEQRTFK